MIKQLLFAFWICAISLGSAYATLLWQIQARESAEADKSKKTSIEQVQTKRISVPVISEGTLKGYVLAQFTFQVDASALKKMTVRPDIFLVDEVFKAIYSGEAINFRNPQKPDVGELSALIKKNVNKRFGKDFVKEVLVQELNYIPQERFRGGALQGDARFA